MQIGLGQWLRYGELCRKYRKVSINLAWATNEQYRDLSERLKTDKVIYAKLMDTYIKHIEYEHIVWYATPRNRRERRKHKRYKTYVKREDR